MIESDILDYVSWFTKETEWMNWDAPWEKDIDIDEKVLYNRFRNRYIHIANTEYEQLRNKFEIIVNDENQTHIGWVSAYLIDDDFNFNIHGSKYAVGIDIPELKYRGKGYGYDALHTFMDYLFHKGVTELYLQTWSGNMKMIRLAHRLGFAEINRYENLRTVSGKTYDALTLKITKEAFGDKYESI
jgi:RimJ/RimL family protein N-acetyltransferase